MRNKLFLILLLLSIGFALSATDYVIISEVLYDSPFNEDVSITPHCFGEFIEIHNAHEEPVNLQGWKLQTLSPAQTFNFPDIELSPKEFLIIAYGDKWQYDNYCEPEDIAAGTTDFHLFYRLQPEETTVLHQKNLILPNTPCTLLLKDADGITKDSLIYGYNPLYNTTIATNNDVNDEDISTTSSRYLYSVKRTNAEFDLQGNARFNFSHWNGMWNPEYSHNSIGRTEVPLNTHTIAPLVNINNHIVQVTPLVPMSSIPTMGETDELDNALIQVDYFDALSRPIQTVQRACTPAKKNLITITEYDKYNRIAKEWLPVPMDIKRAENSAVSATAQQFYNDSRAYVENKYATDILSNNVIRNELIGRQQAGNDMQNHAEGYATQSNTDNEVFLLKWYSQNNILKAQTYYAAKTLYKTTTTDEDNKRITTYTDRNGNVIMTRKGNNADTYYVYNQLGQLAYVLPPMLSANIAINQTISTELINKYAYVYHYDSRGNVIYKKLPGCEPIHMVYDKANRLAIKQDGNQLANDCYTAYKYDKLGRLVYTNEIMLPADAGTIEAIRNVLESEYAIEQCFANSGTQLAGTGYSRQWDNSIDNQLIHSVNYYDDYACLEHFPDDSLQYDNSQEAIYGPRADNVKGLLTCQRDYILDADNDYLTTVFYYDERGRVIQQRSTNHLGGYSVTYTAYSFTNMPTQTLSYTSTADGKYTIERYQYTYDHANRLVKTTYQINSCPSVVLQQTTYDELGRVSKKERYNSMDSICYKYNIRNQITQIHTPEFEENLYYNTIPSAWAMHSSNYYNGNIAVQTWTYGSQLNGYICQYDQLNRYKGAYVILNNAMMDYYFTEHFSYDLQGNIKTLERWDQQDMMNYLHFTYNGNQLTEIADDGFQPFIYSSKRYHDNNSTDSDFGYDANGNLIYDKDRGISSIRYNVLNLPDTINFENGNRIIHRYTASGEKLTTLYHTYISHLLSPISKHRPMKLRYVTTGTHYVGNIEYMINSDYHMRVNHPEGCVLYLTASDPHLVLTTPDHLGNIRESWIYSLDGPINEGLLQRTQYYPSGLPWNIATETTYYPYRYNGKEFVEMHGLDEYDSEARWYYPAIMRTTTMDPLCEQYYDTSPYVWCGNNPIRNVDLNGEAWRTTYSYDYSGMPTPNGFEWIDESKSYDDNGNLLSGLYQQAIFFSDNGTYSPESQYNIGSSTATVYLSDGTIQEFAACTYPSNTSIYPTIPEGDYEAYIGMHQGRYLALKMRDIGATNQTIELGYTNPAHPGQTYAEGVNIHYAGINNFTAIGRDGRAVSEACFLIDRNRWQSFMSIFYNMPQGAKIGIQASRTLSQPINANRYPAYNFIYNGFRENFFNNNIWRW